MTYLVLHHVAPCVACLQVLLETAALWRLTSSALALLTSLLVSVAGAAQPQPANPRSAAQRAYVQPARQRPRVSSTPLLACILADRFTNLDMSKFEGFWTGGVYKTTLPGDNARDKPREVFVLILHQQVRVFVFLSPSSKRSHFCQPRSRLAPGGGRDLIQGQTRTRIVVPGFVHRVRAPSALRTRSARRATRTSADTTCSRSRDRAGPSQR